MSDHPVKPQTRDIVKDALTHQRVSLLSWAFAAVVFGSVGLASVTFTTSDSILELVDGGALTLPPIGDVTRTGSIGESPLLGVMPSVNGRTITGTDEVESAQIATLQREVVALRRRLGALVEQNTSYSRRIASLEETFERGAGTETGLAGSVGTSRPSPNRENTTSPPVIEATPRVRPETPMDTGVNPPSLPEITADVVRERIESVPAPETMSEAYSDVQKRLRQHSGQIRLGEDRIVNAPDRDYQPVRLVDLAETKPKQVVTGSINPEETPEPEEVERLIIEPSSPLGRKPGAGQSLVRHSDFGALVGRYISVEEAQQAWMTFEEQNDERMRDLRPLVSRSDLAEGSYDLLVGPFGNAADAAVACLMLLEVAELCRPALFVGDELPESRITRR